MSEFPIFIRHIALWPSAILCLIRAHPCTAFAVLLRRIIFEEEDSDESWLRKLKAAGFDDPDIQHIHDLVSNKEWMDNALAASPDSSFLFNFANSFYELCKNMNVDYTTLKN